MQRWQNICGIVRIGKRRDVLVFLVLIEWGDIMVLLVEAVKATTMPEKLSGVNRYEEG